MFIKHDLNKAALRGKKKLIVNTRKQYEINTYSLEMKNMGITIKALLLYYNFSLVSSYFIDFFLLICGIISVFACTNVCMCVCVWHRKIRRV